MRRYYSLGIGERNIIDFLYKKRAYTRFLDLDSSQIYLDGPHGRNLSSSNPSYETDLANLKDTGLIKEKSDGWYMLTRKGVRTLRRLKSMGKIQPIKEIPSPLEKIAAISITLSGLGMILSQKIIFSGMAISNNVINQNNLIGIGGIILITGLLLTRNSFKNI